MVAEEEDEEDQEGNGKKIWNNGTDGVWEVWEKQQGIGSNRGVLCIIGCAQGPMAKERTELNW